MYSLFCILFLVVYLAFGMRMCAHANEKKPSFVNQITTVLKDRVDTFSGGVSSSDATSAYGGAVIGLGGKLSQPGWLLRLYTGSGQYVYDADKIYPLRSGTHGDDFRASFAAQTFSAEAMVGYQTGWRLAWVKLFAGLAYERHDIVMTGLALKAAKPDLFDPDAYIIPAGDPGNAAAGNHYAPKFRAEAWAPLTDWAWISADVSAGGEALSYSVFTRLGVALPHGWDLLPQITLGPEASAYGASEYGSARAGGFATFARKGYEFTLSGGAEFQSNGEMQPYLNIGIYRKF